jgi:hypothetical protein
VRFKRSQIDQGAFSSALLRHMVQVRTGELTESEFIAASASVGRRLGLNMTGGRLDLQGKSVGYMAYLADQIAVVASRRNIT